MDFGIFNHQIIYKLGGIEAQKNQSLQSLEKVQGSIFSALKKSEKSYKKIYEATSTVRQSLHEIRDNYLQANRKNRLDGPFINKIDSEINEIFQKFGEQSLALSRKMEKKVQLYAPNMKKLKQKYVSCAESLEHYKQKLEILRKNIEKQSLAKVTQEEHTRFERNKDKLKKASKEHDDMEIEISQRFAQFNNEGYQDIYFDFITLMSTLGSRMVKASNSIMKYLYNAFGATELMLGRELQVKKQNRSIDKHLNLIEMSESRHSDSKLVWLNHLIQEQKLANCMKKLMDQEMLKNQPFLNIQKYFQEKEEKKYIQRVQKTTLPHHQFDQLKNAYSSPHLRHSHPLDIVKEIDPSQMCEDLVDIEIQQISESTPDASMQLQEEQKQSQITRQQQQNLFPDKLKNNLEKFNRICLEKQGTPKQTQEKHLSHILKNNHQIITKQQTIEAWDFFNIISTPKKEINQQKPHEKFQNKIQFDFLVDKSKPYPSAKTLNLGNFKSECGINSSPNIKAAKAQTSHFDLLNL